MNQKSYSIQPHKLTFMKSQIKHMCEMTSCVRLIVHDGGTVYTELQFATFNDEFVQALEASFFSNTSKKNLISCENLIWNLMLDSIHSNETAL